jgi:8-oxo-dGTP diphosphatase
MDMKPFALAVRLLLFNDAGEVLLLKRSRSSKTNPRTWELPGGKIDPGEQFDTALRREIHEETGLVVHLDHAAGTAEQEVPAWHVVHLVMTGSIESGTFRISEEHEAFRWVETSKIKNLELADWFREYYEKTLAVSGTGRMV